MQSVTADAAFFSEEKLAHEEINIDGFDFNPKIENRYVSECGRFESFDCNGSHFEVDWDEIAPPDEVEEPGIPHEVVMREMDELIKELKAKSR